MFTYWKIERYSFNPTTGTHSSVITDEIELFYDPIVRTSLGDGKDSFEFKLVNNNGAYDNFFTIGDKVVIYYAINTTIVSAANIIMTGVINNIPINDKSSGDILTISGNNFSETLMSAITFVDGSNLPINQFIQQAINSVSTFNSTFNVTWDRHNPTTRTDGSAFPNGERWYNKSLNRLLEKYSTSKVTGDVNYYWFVDANNKLVWRPQTKSVSAVFDARTSNYKSLVVKKNTKEVINFVVVKGQTSPSGKVIQARVDNPASRVKNGFKPRIIVSQANYASELTELDRTQPNFSDGSIFPDSYPFTTAWNSSVTASNPTMTPGLPVTVNSDDEYNTAITNQVKHRLKEEGTAYLEERGSGKVMVEITFAPGDANNGDIWRIGDVVNVTIPKIGKNNDVMRVEQAEYSATTEKYVLIEDEGTI